ncbi:precorrin-3B C(17)-methyltransferase [Burkholderia pseudomallei]|uniref:precorrin-3B C(17)-methyltransferase n=1 Tax=Burkholderia pseudomallei TaxID=28450 RepID=UPI0034DE9F57
MTAAPAIVILGPGALETARRIQARFDGARVHALAGRAEADLAFAELGPHLRELYARGAPIVALFAAGIAIRCVAPCLADKGAEPPVLAVAEDGSAVVPLLGGLAGANALAREIADALGVAAAITTSGELRFGACMLNPPEGYALADLDAGKRFVSDLLAGESTRVEGDARWLDDVALPRDAHAARVIRVTPHASRGDAHALLIHPRSVVVALGDGDGDNDGEGLRAPLRFVETNARDAAGVLDAALPAALAPHVDASRAAAGSPRTTPPEPRDVAIAVARAPVYADALGIARGRLTVLGLGPGRADLMTPAARAALADATDIVGYATYVNMAGPLRADQQLHVSDNREELQRARHAFELAARGRRVAVVSSGDPGVFAMAAAVLEALDGADDARWAAVELDVVPGVSAALATAAEAGAPLGHDFCLISLSDNLKPWAIIEKRIDHAAAADFALAFYNPVSRARPVQFDRALDIVRRHRAPETVVVLGRDIGRPGATLATTTLAALSAQQVDMRTMVIVGSSTTRRVARDGARDWVYTPRWYR